MIYLLGMSHMIGLLHAVQKAEGSVSLENWSTQEHEGFFPVKLKPGMLPGDQLQALVIGRQAWDPLVHYAETGGRRVVNGHAGFIQALQPLQEQQEDHVILSYLNGNGHAALSILQHPQPFDFVLPGHEDMGMQPGFQPLSHELIRKHIQPFQVSTIGALSFLRVLLPKARIIHILPPPPSSEQQIRSKPELFEGPMATTGVSPLSVRRKYYLLANRILREQVHGLGIELLDAPPASMAADGSLREELSAGATHGNSAYGELVAAQLRDLL
ncbi:hypothetical protein GTP46_22685 [Duganella sp. FT135W]|uniref:Uncharacterized protein n=1 Tax=Duganella flavida TaxID=2692175 RepID=A0A6L8KLI9_9BURK|nr:hypothetical protein [Duganella flavida]MYM25441.1 hypothetical protein [Duganella flavida]